MFEIFIYIIAALGALCIAGFAVHMFITGLVSTETETDIIAAVCLIIAFVIAFMAWDVIQRRSGKK